VILLDLTLPDRSGESLITEVVNKRLNVPVIVLTGFANMEFGVRSLALKASDYLMKDDINAGSLYKSIKYNIERKKTNQLLEQSEKRYSNLFQMSPQPMWILDIDSFQFVQVNRAAVEHYGFSESEFLNLTLFDLVVDDFSMEEKLEKARAIAHSPEAYKGRIRHKKKNGELIESDVYSNLIQINERMFESVIAIDVTEKMKVEHRITKAIIKTQEDERYEIGTELHDNICQILASSLLSLDMLKDKMPPESVQWHNKTTHFITLALDEIRNISHRLAPSFFDNNNIQDSFQELLDDINPDNKYIVSLIIDLPHTKNGISRDIQLNLYRILQEQLRNIVKYASATHIDIQLHVENNMIHFIISDDGKGFEYSEVKKGIGLSNMRRRAELFNGSMDISSKPGNGCKLSFKIPII
jgi:PAS domain S-box-containing protein